MRGNCHLWHFPFQIHLTCFLTSYCGLFVLTCFPTLIMSSHSPSPDMSDVPEDKSTHHGSGRSWTEEQTSILQANQQEYRDASDAVRAQILGRVMQDMLAILPNGNSLNKEERAVVKGVSNIYITQVILFRRL